MKGEREREMVVGKKNFHPLDHFRGDLMTMIL